MFTKFEIGKNLSAGFCALLFGSTMILSAVGPARANSDVARTVLAQAQAAPAAGYYLA